MLFDNVDLHHCRDFVQFSTVFTLEKYYLAVGGQYFATVTK